MYLGIDKENKAQDVVDTKIDDAPSEYKYLG
jgi:hypothetical protein